MTWLIYPTHISHTRPLYPIPDPHMDQTVILKERKEMWWKAHLERSVGSPFFFSCIFLWQIIDFCFYTDLWKLYQQNDNKFSQWTTQRPRRYFGYRFDLENKTRNEISVENIPITADQILTHSGQVEIFARSPVNLLQSMNFLANNSIDWYRIKNVTQNQAVLLVKEWHPDENLYKCKRY